MQDFPVAVFPAVLQVDSPAVSPVALRVDSPERVVLPVAFLAALLAFPAVLLAFLAALLAKCRVTKVNSAMNSVGTLVKM